MRLIFLDVDGVLNHSGCRERTPQGYYFVEDQKLDLLQSIVEVTGAEVVLSSSWRKGYYDLAAGKETADGKDFLLLRDKLLEWGIEIIGYTPMFETAYRGSEIMAWLKEHEELGVEDILILDDDKDMEPFGRYLLRTTFLYGLQPMHVTRAISILTEGTFSGFFAQYREGTMDEAHDVQIHGRVRE